VALGWMSLKTMTKFKATYKVLLHVKASINKEDASAGKIPPAITTREQLKVATLAPGGPEMIDPT
jgi:hypothetical protein